MHKNVLVGVTTAYSREKLFYFKTKNHPIKVYKQHERNKMLSDFAIKMTLYGNECLSLPHLHNFLKIISYKRY